MDCSMPGFPVLHQLLELVFFFFLQFSAVAQSSPALQPHESQHTRPPCPSPTPGVYSNLCRVGDTIQPSHPLSSPSPPAPNPSQHQGLFQWVNSSHEVGQSIGSFSFRISPSNEHPGLISFWMNWLQNIFQVFMPFYIPTSNVQEFQAILFLVYFLYNFQTYVVHVIYGSVSEFSLFFSCWSSWLFWYQYHTVMITEACNNSWNQIALSPSTFNFFFGHSRSFAFLC